VGDAGIIRTNARILFVKCCLSGAYDLAFDGWISLVGLASVMLTYVYTHADMEVCHFAIGPEIDLERETRDWFENDLEKKHIRKKT